ncbi:hypothetical protein LCGC14_3140550 [marine sediment metagenome]|uniref:DUF4326 domain-containing protein n=1 Tax=marine sediment metagenome TaxID=412755 RepID=A0A0F8VWW8_9ZZZZ
MKVVNLKKESYTHYIGRGSIFGNRFYIGKDGTREEVINKYEKWVQHYLYCWNYKLYGGHLQILSPLGQGIYDLPENAILGCYCKPLACHGDVIIKIWKELHGNN